MTRMRKLWLFPFFLSFAMSLWAADKLSAPELIALAKTHNPQLRSAIEASFDAKDLKEGTAW